MVERACLRLAQDGRCEACGGGTASMDVERDGRLMIESTCARCNASRIDPKEPVQEQSATPFSQLLLQTI